MLPADLLLIEREKNQVCDDSQCNEIRQKEAKHCNLTDPPGAGAPAVKPKVDCFVWQLGGVRGRNATVLSPIRRVAPDPVIKSDKDSTLH